MSDPDALRTAALEVVAVNDAAGQMDPHDYIHETDRTMDALRAALSPQADYPSGTDADAAWAEAEAAAPRGMFGPAVEHRWPDRWRAWYYLPQGAPLSIAQVSAFGGTEPEALRNLVKAAGE